MIALQEGKSGESEDDEWVTNEVDEASNGRCGPFAG